MNQPHVDFESNAMLDLLLQHQPDQNMQLLHQSLDAVKRKLQTLIVLLAANAIILVIVSISSQSVLPAAKLLLSEVMILCGIASLALLISHKKIEALLKWAESEGNYARDRAFIDLALARQELEHLHQRLKGEDGGQAPVALPRLLKSVGPLVMLFAQKEKSALRWGMLALKVAQNAFALIKERSKDS